MASKRSSSGTCSGGIAETLGAWAEAAFARVSSIARSLTSTAQTLASGDRLARTSAMGP